MVWPPLVSSTPPVTAMVRVQPSSVVEGHVRAADRAIVISRKPPWPPKRPWSSAGRPSSRRRLDARAGARMALPAWSASSASRDGRGREGRRDGPDGQGHGGAGHDADSEPAGSARPAAEGDDRSERRRDRRRGRRSRPRPPALRVPAGAARRPGRRRRVVERHRRFPWHARPVARRRLRATVPALPEPVMRIATAGQRYCGR